MGDAVSRDLNIHGLAAAFKTATDAGKSAMIARLEQPITDTIELEKRQAHLKTIRAKLKESGTREKVASARKILTETESALISVGSIRSTEKDDRLSEYYSQILWHPTSMVAPLNANSFANETMVAFRTLFLPGMAVIMPLLLLLAPILVFWYVLKQPLTFNGYFTLLSQSIKKAMPSMLGKARFTGRGGVMELGEQFVHMAVSAGVFIASIWNQVSSAITMRTAVADMRSRAAAVRAFTEATRDLGAAIGCPTALPDWPLGDLGLFGAAWNTPALILQIHTAAGELDMLSAIALQTRTCYPKAGDTLTIRDLYHPGTGAKRIYNSLSMGLDGSRNHVLLTGPNRGGKSTMLKSLGAAVLMAQTLGVVFARSATLPIFSDIITALAPADSLGKMSLFESEIEFAKDVQARLAVPGRGPMFLMMDEIFHGTNAHDGVEASQVFLDDLYGAHGSGVFSVVSTHYMELPARYSKKAQALCMEATQNPDDPDSLTYTYRLTAGVNRFSSVREILRERGLLRPVSPKIVGASE